MANLKKGKIQQSKPGLLGQEYSGSLEIWETFQLCEIGLTLWIRKCLKNCRQAQGFFLLLANVLGGVVDLASNFCALEAVKAYMSMGLFSRFKDCPRAVSFVARIQHW